MEALVESRLSNATQSDLSSIALESTGVAAGVVASACRAHSVRPHARGRETHSGRQRETHRGSAYDGRHRLRIHRTRI